MNTRFLFTHMPPGRLFLITAGPGAVGMLASVLFYMVDGIFIGETAFAALNLALPFVIINFSLSDLIGVGSSVPIAIKLGEKKNHTANNIFTCACVLTFLTSIGVGALLYFGGPYLLSLLGAKGELHALALSYLRVYALTAPVTTIVFGADSYLRICGQIRTSMFLNIGMAVISFVLEFLFLAVFGWGIWAAAFASSLAMMAGAAVSLYPFWRGYLQLKFCRPSFSAAMIANIFVCGCPIFLNNVSGPIFLNNVSGRLTSIMMNFLLLRFGGTTAVSVYGVLMYADSFITQFLYGMCDALQPAVGYNWGAGNSRRISQIERYCYGTNSRRISQIERYCYGTAAGVSLISAAVMILFPLKITQFFVPDGDSGLLTLAAAAVPIFAVAYLARWVSLATESYMTAVGKYLQASVISVVTAFAAPALILIVLFPLGLDGLWLNYPLTAIVCAVLSVIIIKRFSKDLLAKAKQKHS